MHYRQNVPVVDSEQCIMVCFVGSPDDPGYDDAVEAATEAILAANREAGWKKKEKRHKHGDFPAVACGISFGKGQPEPMQLGGERQEMMKKLLAMDSFRRIAGFQSMALRTWFPRCYEEAQWQKAQLLELQPNLHLNFDNSVYLCTTINFRPSMWTRIHTDSKNDPSLPCAITSGGKYNWKLGRHLILWDFDVIFEFPLGTTILLSSAILWHSNIPVAKGETRISVTQYTAGSIHYWLEYGGRTKKEFEKADPEAYLKEMSECRAGRWKESLARYSTFEELRSSA
ncbi:hypothetical protein EV359DRAFT_52135 [Lentinula novae-zelandiae]|nr:hypothetical protein EV359DRAFT_52135 [Lentinula novae-zelandiae]